ncbi:hypothetical protein EPR50_G00123060 [Perca flavescens]|uniref:Uncharacterized protein n=1 Tax=Perca flavescens TaxID=8167 RepID=A0A484CTK1_PERFV|nr:hypothetical protein EPR50_G00123060 [Perca flavescens]
MTSPFCLGFLYDPGISHFPHQTSASNTGEHNTLCLSLAHTPSFPAAATHPESTERPQQHPDLRRWWPPCPHRVTPRKDPSRSSTPTAAACTTHTKKGIYGFIAHIKPLRKTFLYVLIYAGDPSSSCHHVRGAAIQRGENERLRGGQRGQPDVL